MGNSALHGPSEYQFYSCIKCGHYSTPYGVSNVHDDKEKRIWCSPRCIKCYEPHWHEIREKEGDRWWFEIKDKDGYRKLIEEEIVCAYKLFGLTDEQVLKRLEEDKISYEKINKV